MHAVFPSRRSMLPAVRELIEFLAAECAWLSLAERGEERKPEATRQAVSATISSKNGSLSR